MPNSALGWAMLLVAVTPGCFAIRGWCDARHKRLSDALGVSLAFAAAFGLAWTGTLVLSLGAPVLSLMLDASSGARPALWLAVAATLWAVPYLLGRLAGRLVRRDERIGRVVALVLADGSEVHGVCRYIGDERVVVTGAVMGDLHGSDIEVARAEVRAIATDPHSRIPSPDAGRPRDATPWTWPSRRRARGKAATASRPA